MSRVRTAAGMGVREYARTPVLLALLVGLPAYVVVFFGQVVPEGSVALSVPGEGFVRVSLGAATAVTMAPMAAALVGGVAGLFLVQSARDVDGRLVLAGMRVREVLAARFAVLGLAALLAGGVSVAALAVTHVPEAPAWFLAATVAAGLSYGALGVLVGLVLDRLAGVYVMLFGPLLDLFLAQSPFAADPVAVAPYLPGHYPVEVALDAAFTATVSLETAGRGLLYLGAVALLTWAVFALRVRTD